jgi:hypothetical protein
VIARLSTKHSRYELVSNAQIGKLKPPRKTAANLLLMIHSDEEVRITRENCELLADGRARTTVAGGKNTTRKKRKCMPSDDVAPSSSVAGSRAVLLPASTVHRML